MQFRMVVQVVSSPWTGESLLDLLRGCVHCRSVALQQCPLPTPSWRTAQQPCEQHQLPPHTLCLLLSLGPWRTLQQRRLLLWHGEVRAESSCQGSGLWLEKSKAMSLKVPRHWIGIGGTARVFGEGGKDIPKHSSGLHSCQDQGYTVPSWHALETKLY